ncbi:MAG: hypothetical protein KC933_39530, partial [Myxococcales bacterium]|nr:hypothetical protein [Myxococcales bacterium]
MSWPVAEVDRVRVLWRLALAVGCTTALGSRPSVITLSNALVDREAHHAHAQFRLDLTRHLDP